MLTFTIAEVEKLTGLKAQTLRLWEQRHQLIIPRNKNARRTYDKESLKQLLRLAVLHRYGWKTSRLATLSVDEIKNAVEEITAVEADYDFFISRLLEAALDFDESNFVTALSIITEKIGFEDCITKVCNSYLIKLAQLQPGNKVRTALQHFSAGLIQNRIIIETGMLNANADAKPEMVLLSVSSESPDLPLLFIRYLLKKNSWKTIFFGSNVKPEEVESIIALPAIHYLYIHVNAGNIDFDADEYFESLCKKFGNKKIIASGKGIQNMQRNFTNLELLKSDEEIYAFIANVNRET